MSEIEKHNVVVNKDNEWLQPMWGCGFVDEFNGPGAEEIRDFTPTRHELIQLVKYWAEVEIDLSYFMFVHNTTGSDWLRKRSFAGHRIGRIAKIIGKDEVNKAVDEVYAKFGEKQDKRYWDIFTSGTSEQWDEIQEEVHRSLSKP